MVQARIDRVVYLHPWTPSDADPEMDGRKKAEYSKMEARTKVKQLTMEDPDAKWAVSTLRSLSR